VSKSKIQYRVTLHVKLEGLQRENDKGLTRELVQEEISRIILKHLGKVGSANLQFEVENVFPFDQEATILLPCIKPNQFCLLWSALAFQSKFKVSIKEIGYE
jgi:RNase P/RNase MRP subunit POP5